MTQTAICAEVPVTTHAGTRRFHRRLSDIDLFGILFWSLEAGVTGANDTFLEMLGYTREDAEAKRIDWNALTPPEYAKDDREAFDAIARCGRTRAYEKEF